MDKISNQIMEYDLAGRIIGLAMRVHATLGPGFLESVYENAIEIELNKAGIHYERQKALLVFYEGQAVGEFICDFLVERDLIVELKAVLAINPAHEVQTVNYLAATSINDGLLLNFGASSLEFKRKFRSSKQSNVVNSVK